MVGDADTVPLIKAFQLFATMKQNLCGTRNFDACIDEYGVWQDYQRLFKTIANDLGLSPSDEDQGSLINTLTKLDNRIIDMAICDALQDEELSRRTGYDHATYCDGHGLAEYRVIGSEPVGHSMQRGNDERDPGLGYVFESNGVDKLFEIRKFLDK
jgi:hypothetical protein